MVITREEKRMWSHTFSLFLVSLGPTYNRELFLQRTNTLFRLSLNHFEMKPACALQ
jgi:hypothetical protein